MGKKIENKKKLASNTATLKADKSKLNAQERQNEKSRLREEQSQKTQKNEELKILEHQVNIYYTYRSYYFYLSIIYKNNSKIYFE